jgi:hypothetical protein
MNNLQGDSSSGQIVTGLIVVAIIFILMFVLELLGTSIMSAQTRFQTLIPYTVDSQQMQMTIYQNINVYPNAIPVLPSINERSGIEFAYSFYILVLPSTFEGTQSFKHVFHKGYAFAWPLMGPGVFMRGDTNAMRVVMNTYKNPYTYVDIHNIPINKWVHVVLNCIDRGMDVYINGSLANRISFKDTMPYQNYEDIILFSPTSSTILGQGGTPTSLGGGDFVFAGAFNGYLSKLTYTRYGLSPIEIQNLMSSGASPIKQNTNIQLPPYTSDDWWTTQN